MRFVQSKTSEVSTGNSLGSVVISSIGDHVVELKFLGYTSRATAQRALEISTESFLKDPSRNAAVFQVLSLVGHDPGNIALGLRWAAALRNQLVRVALVTRSTTLRGVVDIARAVNPFLEMRAFDNTDDAMKWCESATVRSSKAS
jgi:hypothetical protein